MGQSNPWTTLLQVAEVRSWSEEEEEEENEARRKRGRGGGRGLEG